MSRVVFSRNIFIDSEINTIGNGLYTRINFPTSNFTIGARQTMKLTLVAFEMRRNFYSINQTNNTFYLFNFPTAGDYTEFVISPGNYADLDDLKTAIETAITAVGALSASTVAYDATTRKFVITLDGADPTSYFCSFQVKEGTPPAGVSDGGYFNDANEILGGFSTKDGFTVPVNLFGTTVGDVAHTTPFVASLNSIEALYLRIGLPTNNFQTYGFERELANQTGLTPSAILARIPLVTSYSDPLAPFITFEDPNNLFNLILQQTQLSSMTLQLTDDKGRLLPEVSAGQAASGNLAFKVTLRWDIVEQEVPDGEYRVPRPQLENMRIQP
jgi:hypothetical protein